MFGLGIGEILIVGIIAFVMFGGSRMAEFGKGLGDGIRNFKKAISDINEKGN